ncbi:hypothetical protein G6329_17485 [Vibrio cholerae]|uniref:hypothetical protein n=1 Tax=Vibrio TaxID=662 RepID=UPI0008519B51|nr:MULTISPECIES: hypothetical protein [Vibrio]EGR0667178.1 hypothetical protein [Vibrio cholerae]EGR1466037.1 hypothetical protein [Vibrio cholerae]EIC9845579.1 hypothetical protein [Vibrio cholerae]EJL6300441.1 hypothetical protein [Vibrio cholerae]EJL6329264.1 hypothetical protein [Vibrio cholerae]
MSDEILIAIFTAIGAIIGGGISHFTSAKIKQIEFRQSNIRYELENRRKLYSEFLAEANSLVLNSIEKKSSEPTFLSDICRLLAEIELLAGKDVYDKAKEIVGHILDLNGEVPVERKNMPEIRAQFVELVKIEFRSIEQQT